MTQTQWKKSKIEKSSETDSNNDNSTIYDEPTSIPTFKVLNNTPMPTETPLTNVERDILDEQTDKLKKILEPYTEVDEEDEKIIEGLSKFQLFSDDNYYKSCKSVLKKFKLDWILTAIHEAIKYALCPLSKTDQLIDKGVENFVRLFVQLRNCMKDENIEYEDDLDLSPVSRAELLWNDGDAPLQYTGEYDKDEDEQEFIIEGYQSSGTNELLTKLLTNIYSLRDAHSWINTDDLTARMGSHYIGNFNLTENRLGRYLTEDELFHFHNFYNDALERQTVINVIKSTPISQQWISLLRLTNTNSNNNTESTSNWRSIEPERVLSECEKKQRAAIQELKQNAKHVKRQIYNIVMVPVVIYIVYNMYFVFLFMDSNQNIADSKKSNKINSFFKNIEKKMKKKAKKEGEEGEEEDQEQEQENQEENQEENETYKGADYVKFLDYDQTFAGVTRLITEYLFRPVQLIIAVGEWIKGNGFKLSYYHYGRKQYEEKVFQDPSPSVTLHDINNLYPQILFFVLFVVIFVGWRKNTSFIPKTIKNLYKGKHPLTLNYFALIVTMISFVISLGSSLQTQTEEEGKEEETAEDKLAGATKNISEALSNMSASSIFHYISVIVFWIFKWLFAYNMVSLSVSITLIYGLSYLLFGIYLYSSKPFDTMQLINNYLYTKMYKPARVGDPNGNMLIDGFNGVCRTIFTHLFEVITIIMLMIGMNGYIKKINNADLNTFLMLMSGFLIFLLCCNMMLKNMNMKTVLRSLLKFWKIKVKGDELEEEDIEEIKLRAECVSDLNYFMDVFTDKIKVDDIDFNACRETNQKNEGNLMQEREENKSMFANSYGETKEEEQRRQYNTIFSNNNESDETNESN